MRAHGFPVRDARWYTGRGRSAAHRRSDLPNAIARRTFLGGLAASALVGRSLLAQQTGGVAVEIGASKDVAPVPADFVGLSYESAQLANPRFFSSENKELVALFRELAPRGNLRLGGGSSEYTTYADEAPAEAPFEVFGPDTSKTVKHGTITSALALRQLRGFLDSAGWNCLYGLNLGQGSVENAVKEATAAAKILGERLLAFQIGNEPDSFKNRYRPATYSPADYLVEWRRFHDAIAGAVPGAKFAGPDISNKLTYLTAFAEQKPMPEDVVLLTSHYYAMGPARNPAATLDNLLSPDPKLTTLKRADLHVIAEAQQAAGLPYRMSEGNSCWDGGKPGVSDTFASALWCADYMLQCMGRGWAGVNMHGGGNGFYTPIAGAPSTGFQRRPEFFGIRFAQRYVGARCVDAALTGANPRVAAYVFEREGERELVLINKTASEVSCAVPRGTRASARIELTAPAIDARGGVKLERVKVRSAKAAVAPAYSATAFVLEGK